MEYDHPNWRSPLKGSRGRTCPSSASPITPTSEEIGNERPFAEACNSCDRVPSAQFISDLTGTRLLPFGGWRAQCRPYGRFRTSLSPPTPTTYVATEWVLCTIARCYTPASGRNFPTDASATSSFDVVPKERYSCSP